MGKMVRLLVVSSLLGAVPASLLWLLIPIVADSSSWKVSGLVEFGIETVIVLFIAIFSGLVLAISLGSRLNQVQ